MIVSQILGSKPKSGVLTISKNKTVRDAISDLSAHRIGALVVSDDGKTVDGIISERDIIRETGKHGLDCFGLKVSELMTKKIISCTRDDTSESALKMMTEGRFRHLPVVEDGVLIGLISIGDVVKARLSEVEHENSAMLDMIAGR